MKSGRFSTMLIVLVLLVSIASMPVWGAPAATDLRDEPQEVMPSTFPLPKSKRPTGVQAPDPALQLAPGAGRMPTPLVNFEGISATGVLPPDTNGQVGPNHYVQIVNAWGPGSQVRIWDKTGVQLYDFGMGDLWSSGECSTTGGNPYGDPVVLYDQLADRWLLTQFALPAPPYYECIAVSKTGAPTDNPNDWYLYSFLVHNTKMNDYPKLGVWPGGYFMMAHQFTATWAGTGVWAFDRASMLAGTPPQNGNIIDCTTGTNAFCQYIDLYPVNSNYGGMLPVNLMSNSLPPDSNTTYYVEVDMNWNGTDDILTIFEAQATWGPNTFSFSVVDELVVAPFTWPLCSAYRGRCVHQPDGAPQLEAIADRLMMHAWYRNMGDHEVIVASHTVDAGSNRAGIRWYEIRKDSGGDHWYIYQQGTYHPDSDHRWMGSIAMDRVGNIALGFSVSSETTYPSIRYVGRLVSDPLGILPQAEEEIIAGSGVQQHTSPRWGDYSAMSVDPVDDCTFWYTQEYIETTGWAPWQTRIASFVFPSCLADPEFALGKVPSERRVEAGDLLTYTLTVTNTGGPATGVTISDTLPANTQFAWADNGGAPVGNDIVWTNLAVGDDDSLSVSFAVTVTCVASGTEILNDGYAVKANEWLTPTHGAAVAVTAVQEGITAAFDYPQPVLLDWPVQFTNLSQNATDYEWAFGDGGSSYEAEPNHAYPGPAGDHTVVLTASNLCTEAVTSQVLTVHDYDVEIGPAAAAAAANLGETVSYTVWVTNSGTLSDAFRIRVGGNAWPTAPSTDTFTLEPAAAVSVVVEVTAPVDAEGGTEDKAAVTVRASSDPRSPAASAMSALTTRANTVYAVALGPAASTSTADAGETVTYTLVVTNTGNVVDTVTFSRVGSGWVTTISPLSLVIARGGHRTVEVYVTLPAGATEGISDMAVIRATGSSGYAESQLTTSVEDVQHKTYLPQVFKNR